MAIHTFATENIASKIDIRNQFNHLSKTVFGEDSPYIRAKESMIEYFAGSSISEREKAEFMTKFATDMAVQTTNKLLDSALSIETSNRNAPYELAKVKADVLATYTNTDRVDQARVNDMKAHDKMTEDINAIRANIYSTVASTYSKTGYSVSPIVTGYMDTATARLSSALDVANVKSVDTSRYATLAASYVKDGMITVIEDPSELTYTFVADATSRGNSLSEAERLLSIRQKEAFDDDRYKAAVSGAANVMGMALSSGNGDILSGTTYTGTIPVAFQNALTELSSVTP